MSQNIKFKLKSLIHKTKSMKIVKTKLYQCWSWNGVKKKVRMKTMKIMRIKQILLIIFSNSIKILLMKLNKSERYCKKFCFNSTNVDRKVSTGSRWWMCWWRTAATSRCRSSSKVGEPISRTSWNQNTWVHGGTSTIILREIMENKAFSTTRIINDDEKL